MLGTISSGIVEVFIDRETFFARLPKNRFLGVLLGALMGLIFPVCECGVVPLTRRLYNKGLPPAIGIAFLLAAPILNPIVILSTITAFGFGPILWGRIGLSLVIAMIVGLIFSGQPATEILRDQASLPVCSIHNHTHPQKTTRKQKWIEVARIAADELFEMGQFLILGSLLAALMQTVVPQNTLLALGNNPLTSILIMLLLAFILSICSTVDAFVALSFAANFSKGALLAFLVFGPMVDIKSIFMFSRVFKRKVVAYLVLLPLLLVMLLTLFINTQWGF